MPLKFPVKLVSDVPLIPITGKHPYDWKIFIPPTLINDAFWWYHETLRHFGSKKLYDTISSRLYSPNLSSLCKDYKCNINKQPKQAIAITIRSSSSSERDGSSVGQSSGRSNWSIENKGNGRLFVFNALTCIDPVTNLVKIIRIWNKTSKHVVRNNSKNVGCRNTLVQTAVCLTMAVNLMEQISDKC